MRRKCFDIAFCVNDGYTMPLMVALRSIFETTEQLLHIHILFTSLTQENRRKIRDFCLSTTNICTFHDVSKMLPEVVANGEYGRQGTETMMRFLLPKVLPTRQLVLYLDCDIIAKGDITEVFRKRELLLWHNLAAAVAEDCTADIQKKHDRRFGAIYFNAGVMLINLDYWRAHGITAKAFEIAILEPDLQLHDQDILNIILAGKTYLISNACNVQNGFLWKRRKTNAQINNPTIIHFTGPHKPWKHTCDNPYRDEWRQIYKRTFGKDFKLRRSLRGFLARLWYKYSPFVKLKEQYINIK